MTPGTHEALRQQCEHLFYEYIDATEKSHDGAGWANLLRHLRLALEETKDKYKRDLERGREGRR